MRLFHFLFGGVSKEKPSTSQSIYDDRKKYGDLLSAYRGQVILVVNTATQCGFARQYDALETLYQRYKASRFVVVGFPSNDFAGQEPGSDAEIESVCRINHGVSFPLMPKAPVSGKSRQPLFNFLVEDGPADLSGRVWWNFEKFLIDREGHLIGRWRSYVSPTSRGITRAIERALQPSQHTVE